MVGALSALEANDSKGNLVRRSELNELMRAERSRHAHVQPCVNHLAFQHADIQATRRGRHFIRLRVHPLEACRYETDPPFDFEQAVSAFVENAAQI